MLMSRNKVHRPLAGERNISECLFFYFQFNQVQSLVRSESSVKVTEI